VKTSSNNKECILQVPPGKSIIDTPLANLWFDDGILYSVSKPGARTMADLRKTLEAIKNTTGNKKICLIADTSNTQYYTIEMRNELSREFLKLLNALALIPCNPMGKIMASILFHRQNYFPTKIFDNTKDAKEWIAQYK
jgi:hypothetical protein